MVGATRAQAATVDPAIIEAEVLHPRAGHGGRRRGSGGHRAAAGMAAAGDPCRRPRGGHRVLLAMLDLPGFLDELQRIQVPTLVLAGDQDPGLTHLRATADSIPAPA